MEIFVDVLGRRTEKPSEGNKVRAGQSQTRRAKGLDKQKTGDENGRRKKVKMPGGVG
jgi:hypothetical protein